MNGLIPTLISICAIPLVVYTSLKKKNYYFLPLILQMAIYAFMIYTLQRNTPINQPDLTFANIFSQNTINMQEFNIRYGLSMLPLIALLSTYIFRIKSTLFRFFMVLLIVIQIYSYFRPNYTVIYQLPNGNNIEMLSYENVMSESDFVGWMKKHYDYGLIMISQRKHNPEMLQLGFDFKTYIHEGTGKYWLESTKSPQTYARWIVFDSYQKNDQVTRYLGKSSILSDYYDLVYSNKGIKVYRIKQQ